MNLSQRLINLVNPLGYGQRALIVSPPKAGKTQLLKDIANGISGNHPEVHIMVVLVGERDRKSTRLNSSHVRISYAVFCLKKKNHQRSRADGGYPAKPKWP